MCQFIKTLQFYPTPYYLSNEIKLLKLSNLITKTAKQVIKHSYFFPQKLSLFAVFLKNAKTSYQKAKSEKAKAKKQYVMYLNQSG